MTTATINKTTRKVSDREKNRAIAETIEAGWYDRSGDDPECVLKARRAEFDEEEFFEWIVRIAEVRGEEPDFEFYGM